MNSWLLANNGKRDIFINETLMPVNGMKVPCMLDYRGHVINVQ